MAESRQAGACTCSGRNSSGTNLCCCFVPQCTPLHVYFVCGTNGPAVDKLPLPSSWHAGAIGAQMEHSDTLAGCQSTSLEDQASIYSSTCYCSMLCFCLLLENPCSKICPHWDKFAELGTF